MGFIWGALALAASACGGSSGTCGVQPCGGDVVGTWQAKSACADPAVLNEQFAQELMGECPGLTMTGVTLQPNGSMMFGSDLSYTANLAMSISFNLNFPASCLQGQSCPMVNDALQSIVGSDGIQSATCSGSGSCTCKILGLTTLESSSGTYATAGSVLTLTATAGVGDSGSYCVQGSTLHLVDVDMTMPMGKVESDIMLTRQ